jgi:hypothetical protein
MCWDVCMKVLKILIAELANKNPPTQAPEPEEDKEFNWIFIKINPPSGRH